MADSPNGPYIPSVYTVAWPDGVWKVGYTITHRRWLHFVGRGATLVDLTEFQDDWAARAFEKVQADAFAEISTPAFACADQSRLHLGSGRSGWTECFRIDPVVAEWCASIIPAWSKPYDHQGRNFTEQCLMQIAVHACLHHQTLTARDLDGLEYWDRNPDVVRGTVVPLMGAMWAYDDEDVA